MCPTPPSAVVWLSRDAGCSSTLRGMSKLAAGCLAEQMDCTKRRAHLDPRTRASTTVLRFAAGAVRSSIHAAGGIAPRWQSGFKSIAWTVEGSTRDILVSQSLTEGDTMPEGKTFTPGLGTSASSSRPTSSVGTDGRIDRRTWPKRMVTLAAGVVLALSVAATTPTSAPAYTTYVSCGFTIVNDTPWVLHPDPTTFYWHGNIGPNTDQPADIAPGDQEVMSASSLEPIGNHCSINVTWFLEVPVGYVQTMSTYVYAPNSGSNGFDTAVSGEFAKYASATQQITDNGANAYMTVTVTENPSGVPSRSPSAPRSAGDLLSPAGDAAKRSPEAKQVPGLLHRGDLIGQGWKRAARIKHLGHLGRILAQSKVPASASCDKAKDEPTPLRSGQRTFWRRGGEEFIGASHHIYSNARQARRMTSEAVSAHGIACLARAYSSKRFNTSVSTERRSVTLGGRRLILNRLRIREHSGGQITRTDYVDFVGMTQGKLSALVTIASDQRPPDARTEAAVFNAVAQRFP